MCDKVKNPFLKFEPKELLANITQLHSEISNFIANNFEQNENETKENKSAHEKNTPFEELEVPTAEQIHNQAEITIQSYKHLHHAKQQYESKIAKIREVRRRRLNIYFYIFQLF